MGVCPGQKESAEQNYSSHAAKGNRFLRRILNQAAHAAVRKKGSYFQTLFQRLLPRLSYKGAIWAVAHRLCRLVWKVLHEGIRYIEQGREPDPVAQRPRTPRQVRKLRNLCYEVLLEPRTLEQATQDNWTFERAQRTSAESKACPEQRRRGSAFGKLTTIQSALNGGSELQRYGANGC